MKKQCFNNLFQVIFLALALTIANSASAQTSKSRMDRTKLNIGTYILQPYASTEAHVRDLAACGIDLVVCARNERPLLDLFSKYHVGAIVSGVVPGWWGGDGSNRGKLKENNPLSKYEEAAAKFEDHPAIWGIDIGDEPSALDFPYYGEIYKKVEELFPQSFPYLNLYPNYASVAKNTEEQAKSQLGTATYEEHIAEYCKYIPADYLCYDFYLYTHKLFRAYRNLRVVADACLGTGRSMWIVLQVNSLDETKWISENQLRFQAYTAMAFGAEVITWACYTAGWWHNQVVDEQGNKTQQYDKLKKVNAELHRLGDVYMKYRRTSSAFVGFEGTEWLDGVGQAGVAAYSNGIFTNVKTDDNSPLVIGSMISRTGDASQALFVCAADDPYDEHPAEHLLRFKAEGRELKAHGGNGEIPIAKDNLGYYVIPIVSNAGILIEAK